MSKSFGDWLFKQMEKSGLNQSELARRSNINQAAVSRLISGKSVPTPDTLLSFARVFKLPPETVFRAAGFLPPENKESKIIELIKYLSEGLPEDEQQNILEYVKLRARLTEERERENKRGASQLPAAPEHY